MTPTLTDALHDREARPTTLDPVYRVQEVAQLLKCDPATIYRLTASGELKSVRVGRLLRIRESDLAAYIASGSN